MARTPSILTQAEIAMVEALNALATGGATEAIRKSGAASFENISAGSSETIVTEEVPSGLVNGSNTTFTIANTPTSGSVKLYRNGIRLKSGAGNDYTITTVTITTAQAPESGDVLLADYRY